MICAALEAGGQLFDRSVFAAKFTASVGPRIACAGMSSKKNRRKEKNDSEEDIPSDESDGPPAPVSASAGGERRSSGLALIQVDLRRY